MSDAVNIMKFHKWKIGQLNVQTCSSDEKLHQTLRECSRANLDVLCLQEVRMLKTGSLKLLGYNFYWSGHQRLRQHGVGIAIRDNRNFKINGIVCSSARLMAVDATVRSCKLRIVSCYAPTLDGAALSTKQSFYRELKKLYKTEKNRKVLVQGDFNAEPEFCRHHSCFEGGRSYIEDGANQTNENVMLFLKHCHTNQLSILNTWYDHPIHHRVSWHHPRGTVKKVYDYSLSHSWLRQYINDVRVRNSYFNSDHRLVVTTLKTPSNKAARHFFRRRKPAKPDMQCMLQSDTIRENVRNAVTDFMVDNERPTSLNDFHDHLIEGFTKGRQLIPKTTKTKQTIPWGQDSQLEDLYHKRVELRKQKVIETVKTDLKKVKKEIKARVKVIQNTILRKKAQGLNQAKETRNIAKLWKQAKSHNTIFHCKPSPIQCPGLSSHFRKHFNPTETVSMPQEIAEPPDYIRLLQNSNLEISNSSPSIDEISDAITQLNNGKSTIDVEAEILKVSSTPEVMESLQKYYHEIWSNKQVPDKWRVSRITPLWKNKGSSTDPTKYRGISIGTVLCKVGMKIVLKRLSTFYEQQLKRTQFGFRLSVSCNDGIYMVKQLQHIASISDKPLYACFVDLTAAFDHIDRKLLFKTIRNRLPGNVSCAPLDIAEELYQSTSSYLQNYDPESDSFPTKSGVRQGSSEGPPFYNCYSDYAGRVYDDRKREAGVPGLSISYDIPNEATNRVQRQNAPTSGECDDADCGYADDGSFFCWSLDDLRTCMSILAQTFSEFGLTLNTDKTETMILNWQPALNETYPETILSLNGEDIKNSTSFKYLGVWINHNNQHIGQEELNHRVNSAHNAFSEHRTLLTNMRVKLSTRVMFLDSLVRSRLTYGCHAWKPSAAELSKIDSTYRYFLRCMIWNGHKRVNPPSRTTGSDSSDEDTSSSDLEDYDWRYVVTNETLYRVSNTKSIKQFYEQQQMKWIAHVIRRENDNICKILTFHQTKRVKRGRKLLSVLERCVVNSGLERSEFLRTSFLKQNDFPP